MTEELDENERRSRIIQQLEESIAMSREMMQNQKLDPNTRRERAQLLTNSCQVLNTVLKDKQNEVWERRMKALEAAGYIPKTNKQLKDVPSSDSARSISV